MSIYYYYSKFFSKKLLYKFHKVLYFISLRGLGMLNSENDQISGEEWFINKIKNDKDLVIFDVGANIGDYSKLLRKNFKESKIVAFEPHPKTFERLRKNTEEDKISIVNSGLGQKVTTLKLFDYKNQEGSEHASLDKNVFIQMYREDIEEFDVNIDTVDNYCKVQQIDQIYFLKIDVEGLEYDVLQGARLMIASGKVEYIQFEFNTNNVYTKTSMNDFQQLLVNYTLYRLLPDGFINLSEEKYLFQEIYAFQNIVAIRNF